MKILKLISTSIVTTLVLSTNTNASLLDRDLDGNLATVEAYYDDVADLTWLADANYSQTSGYSNSGLMNWADANTWAASLDLGGVTGWRLPETVDVGGDGATYTNLYEGVDWGYNITTHSEMSNLFYNVLGNTARYDISGVLTGCASACLTNTGPFSNIQSANYWSATQYMSTASAWEFSMGTGGQGYDAQIYDLYVWPVHDGDVGTIIVPNTPPTVDAGEDQTVTANTTVALSGAASDSDGSITTNLWAQVSGTSVTLNVTDAVDSSFTAPDVS